jgi:RNA polymerase sigma factor for flagellar operon FliA
LRREYGVGSLRDADVPTSAGSPVPFENGHSVKAPTPSREELIQRNLGLVALTVNRMSRICTRGRLEREDAFAYGVAGLIHAIDEYDPTRGVGLSSFALPRIRGAILDAVRRMDLLPRTMRRQVNLVEEASLDLANVLGRWPTDTEVALRTGLRSDAVRDIRARSGAAIVSLEKILKNNPEDTLIWMESDDEESDPVAPIDRDALHEMLLNSLDTLSKRDRLIIELRYVRGETFGAIGKRLNLSESRVCQIHKQIVAKLQRFLEEQNNLAA